MPREVPHAPTIVCHASHTVSHFSVTSPDYVGSFDSDRIPRFAPQERPPARLHGGPVQRPIRVAAAGARVRGRTGEVGRDYAVPSAEPAGREVPRAGARAVPHSAPVGPRGHGRRVPRGAPRTGPARRDQGVGGAARVRSGRARAVPARGALGRRAGPPEHRAPVRRVPHAGRALPRDGVRGRERPTGAARNDRAAALRAGRGVHFASRGRVAARARARVRSPRHQAREPDSRQERHLESARHGLGAVAGEPARRVDRPTGRHHYRHRGLHFARAGSPARWTR